MENCKRAVVTVFNNKKLFFLFWLLFLLVFVSFIGAIELSSSIKAFLSINSPTYIIFQIIFNLINSLIISLIIIFTIFIVRQRKESSAGSMLSAFVSLVLSIGTSGCYFCGTLLLPISGLAISLGSLPLKGLEVKIGLTILLLISLFDLIPMVLGICKVGKRYIFQFKRRSFSLTSKTIKNISFIGINIFIVGILMILPLITKQTVGDSIGESDLACTEQVVDIMKTEE